MQFIHVGSDISNIVITASDFTEQVKGGSHDMFIASNFINDEGNMNRAQVTFSVRLRKFYFQRVYNLSCTFV